MAHHVSHHQLCMLLHRRWFEKHHRALPLPGWYGARRLLRTCRSMVTTHGGCLHRRPLLEERWNHAKKAVYPHQALPEHARSRLRTLPDLLSVTSRVIFGPGEMGARWGGIRRIFRFWPTSRGQR